MDCLATLFFDGETCEVSVTMIEPHRLDMLGFFEELASMPEERLGPRGMGLSSPHLKTRNRRLLRYAG
jgi:hypothetical protein